MLPIYLGQYPDTSAYMEVLSGMKLSHVRHYKGQQEVILLGCMKWNIFDVAS